MKKHFSFDQRLGIPIPELKDEWEDYHQDEQHSILYYWEQIRGSIPDRIAELEKQINQKQAMLSDENDFPRSCELNREIAELASIINDLWIWYRTHQTTSTTKIHA
jgi:hypothetical protein